MSETNAEVQGNQPLEKYNEETDAGQNFDLETRPYYVSPNDSTETPFNNADVETSFESPEIPPAKDPAVDLEPKSSPEKQAILDEADDLGRQMQEAGEAGDRDKVEDLNRKRLALLEKQKYMQ